MLGLFANDALMIALFRFHFRAGQGTAAGYPRHALPSVVA